MRKKTPKSLDQILAVLKKQGDELKTKFFTRELAVFGSYLRGEQRLHSDVDILVEFEPGHKTFDNYMDLKFRLEAVLDCEVDLIVKTALREEFKEAVLSEAVYV
jgi:predicted nucleotidyltransferase